jgi:hypothetical protein
LRVRSRSQVFMPNKSFHLTKPLVTLRADARPAPNDFAGEANVRFARE